MTHAELSHLRGWIQAALVPATIAAAMLLYWGLVDRDEPLHGFEAGAAVPRRPLAPLVAQEEAVRRGIVERIAVIDETVSRDDLARIAALERLNSLTIGSYGGDESDLALLENLPRLEAVRFDDLAVGDAGAKALSQIDTLRQVNLPRASFSDEGLRELATLPNLDLLRFSSPNVTDAGIAALESAPSLKWLHVIRTPLADETLASVARCERLESFYVDGCDFSPAAWQALLAARPDLHIHVDELHPVDHPTALTGEASDPSGPAVGN